MIVLGIGSWVDFALLPNLVEDLIFPVPSSIFQSRSPDCTDRLPETGAQLSGMSHGPGRVEMPQDCLDSLSFNVERCCDLVQSETGDQVRAAIGDGGEDRQCKLMGFMGSC